jgi:hypothetical protein
MEGFTCAAPMTQCWELCMTNAQGNCCSCCPRLPCTHSGLVNTAFATTRHEAEALGIPRVCQHTSSGVLLVLHCSLKAQPLVTLLTWLAFCSVSAHFLTLVCNKQIFRAWEGALTGCLSSTPFTPGWGQGMGCIACAGVLQQVSSP